MTGTNPKMAIMDAYGKSAHEKLKKLIADGKMTTAKEVVDFIREWKNTAGYKRVCHSLIELVE